MVTLFFFRVIASPSLFFHEWIFLLLLTLIWPIEKMRAKLRGKEKKWITMMNKRAGTKDNDRQSVYSI